jgi:hypothetical protein
MLLFPSSHLFYSAYALRSNVVPVILGSVPFGLSEATVSTSTVAYGSKYGPSGTITHKALRKNNERPFF